MFLILKITHSQVTYCICQCIAFTNSIIHVTYTSLIFVLHALVGIPSMDTIEQGPWQETRKHSLEAYNQ